MGNDLHDLRIMRLDAVRKAWCRRNRKCVPDRTGVTIELDGRDLVDIPSFYLALGRAANGPDGYYGGCLDSLSDCLCGNFGLVPPFTLLIYNADSARQTLGRDALLRWRKSLAARIASDPVMTESDLADAALPLTSDSSDLEPYFDSIISVLRNGGVNVVLDSAGT